MASVFSILPRPTKDQEVFILDYGRKIDGKLKHPYDILKYKWNMKKFNKMHVGAYVLIRTPGKSNKDRKFRIIGGGYVESISDPDENDDVVATLSHWFDIVPPIKQGDSFIESFIWDSKTKAPDGSWGHFFNQYGMNTISITDFYNLLRNVDCVSDEQTKLGEEAFLEQIGVVDKDIQITVEYSSKNQNQQRSIDRAKAYLEKMGMGSLGEKIVLDILIKEAQENGCKMPEIVTIDKGGAALPYDIIAWDKDENELHINVKTTIGDKADSFIINYDEMRASLRPNYYIYRIYSLNMKTKEYKLKIYKGPLTQENYNIVPTQMVVYEK